jgi:transcriptional regulator with AAA-type ATPase domain
MLFDPAERHFAEIMSRLVNTNPFLPDWVALEREALGPTYRESPPVYSRSGIWDPRRVHPNLELLHGRNCRLAEQGRQRLEQGVTATDEERPLYESVALYQVYENCYEAFSAVVDYGHCEAADSGNEAKGGPHWKTAIAAAWDGFRADYARFFRKFGMRLWEGQEPAHVFACFFQMRRAFHHIYNNILGSSQIAARLRGAVWQTIFTHDLRRWSRSLYGRMGDFPTLITGPSGTGKELVARAVGLSRHVPFDARKKQFETNDPKRPTADPGGSFYPLNLSALAQTLIESELFGHVAGAFTGAVSERWGKLDEEVCDAYGTVFLDEIGELDAAIQVKLLRVLQDRRFQRLGENKDRRFVGKIVAATNRDLAAEMRAGRFREDFYYRLCADRIETPSLRDQLAEAPEDLYHLLFFVARKAIGDEEAEPLALEVQRWIDQNLGPDYPWPGNFRELEQCVRNVMIRHTYEPVPLRARPANDPRQELAAAVVEGALTAADLERRYFTLVYAQKGSFQEAAEHLGCDWRTLRSKIDPGFLQKLQE